jgi:hypothetical protein
VTIAVQVALYLPADLRRPEVRSELRPQERKALERIAAWAEEYLCRPHEQLGRSGAVCPYVQHSLSEDLFWLAVGHRGDTEEIVDRVLAHRDRFVELEPLTGIDALGKTVLIVFPELTAQDGPLLDRVQKRLKPEFTELGLMIGQFYEGCTEPGIWNRDFHPLQSPVPLLAIRAMVPSDFPFLVARSRFLEPYFERFAHEIPERIRRRIVDELTHERGR